MVCCFGNSVFLDQVVHGGHDGPSIFDEYVNILFEKNNIFYDFNEITFTCEDYDIPPILD